MDDEIKNACRNLAQAIEKNNEPAGLDAAIALLGFYLSDVRSISWSLAEIARALEEIASDVRSIAGPKDHGVEV